MAQGANKEIMALIWGHIEQIKLLYDVPSVIGDKFLAVLNQRFIEKLNSEYPDWRINKRLKERKGFYTRYNARHIYAGSLMLDGVDLEDSFSLTDYSENMGYEINDLYQYESCFRNLVKDTISVYDGCFDEEQLPVDEDTGECLIDAEDSTALFDWALEENNLCLEGLAKDNPELASFMSEMVEYGGVDGEDRMVLILAKNFLKYKAKHKKNMKFNVIMNIITDFDVEDRYGARCISLNENNVLFAFWEGVNSYEFHNFAYKKPAWFWALLWLDYALDEFNKEDDR